MKPARELPLLHKGDVIGEGDAQYIVQRKLGEGQFAEVWEVKQASRSSDVKYALKLEKRKDRSTVKAEYKALNRLRGNTQVIAVEACGTHDERFYMLLQLAGETLFEARKSTVGSRMDLGSVKAVGLSTLAAIQQVHEARWIHRDIKPANFVINPPNSSPCTGSWMLIDFGLVRRYADDGGNHLPQRPDASFRGSTAYASVHAHMGLDLSRRDDLWSWLYMLAELLDGEHYLGGGLPWRPDKDGSEHVQIDKHWVLERKQECIQQPLLLCKSVPVPDALVSISQHLASLGFEDAPDYEFLRQCLQQLPDPEGVPLQDLAGRPTTQQQQQATAGQQREASTETLEPNQLVLQPVQGSGVSLGWAVAAAGNSQQQRLCDPLTPESPQQVSPAAGPQGSPRAAAAGASAADDPVHPMKLGQDPAKRRRLSNGLPEQHQHMPTFAAATHTNTAAGGDVSRHPSTHNLPVLLDGRHDPAVLTSSNTVGGPQWRSRSSSMERQHNHQGSTGANFLEPAAQELVHQLPSSLLDTAVGAAEISGLLAAFDEEAALESKQATQQAVQQLCLLRPTEAVCAIALTLDKLAHQSESSCRSAVAQLLHDLAAYISAGAVVMGGTS